MRRLYHWIAFLVLLFSFCVFFTGCGKNKNEEITSDPETEDTRTEHEMTEITTTCYEETEPPSISEEIIERAHESIWYDAEQDQFHFPYTKESEEWESAPSIAARQKLFVIPDEVLACISTDNLLDLVITYPFSDSFIYSESFQEGFKDFCKAYAGAEILMEREDLGNAVGNAWCSKELLADDHDSVKYFLLLSVFLAQPEVLTTIDPGIAMEVMRKANAVWEQSSWIQSGFVRCTEETDAEEILEERFHLRVNSNGFTDDLN